MMRLFALLLGLVLLGGCVGAPEAPSAVITTIETTAETTAASTTVMTTEEPATANPNGWRTSQTLALSETIEVYEVYNPALYSYDIWLRDKDTGEDALILESQKQQGGVVICVPGKKINERYFSFQYGYLDSEFSGEKFYDVQQRRVIELSDLHYYVTKVENGNVYLVWINSDDEDPRCKQTFYFEISALESGEPVVIKTME